MHRFIKTRFFVRFITLLLLLGSGTAGWTDAAGSNAILSLSQKQSNPGPDQVLGTSARLAFGSGQEGGTGQAGVDAYLYQVRVSFL